MSSDVICLFDLDGTLTKSRNPITPEMSDFLSRLQSHVPLAVVSGSDYEKVAWQLGGTKMVQKLDFVFSENGLVVHRFGKETGCTDIVAHLGEDLIQDFINYALECMSHIRLPRKRGTFVEFRKGLINICPVGRSCSQQEREEFAKYDEMHNIRQKLVDQLRTRFASTELQFAIGGQISFDVFPKGWDKRYCLRFLTGYKTIHFFGDKTEEGGNDYEIFADDRTIGHTVKSPDDTKKKLEELFPSP
ncbi:unnamed protein product [Calicophoron daubneyi]|uniref:Phosphomannomutase n=1 Tax=Calicophoron daubneyi TaxID=300641 RepID=A0AAV2TEE9_CALDB